MYDIASWFFFLVFFLACNTFCAVCRSGACDFHKVSFSLFFLLGIVKLPPQIFFIYLFSLFSHFYHSRETCCGGDRTTEQGPKLSAPFYPPMTDNRRQTTTPGTRCPTLYDKCVGSFTSHRIINIEVMQHFLLSYLKTLSVGPAGVELATSRVTARCSTWATGVSLSLHS